MRVTVVMSRLGSEEGRRWLEETKSNVIGREMY
jgi:hypothetical protein